MSESFQDEKLQPLNGFSQNSGGTNIIEYRNIDEKPSNP